MAENEFAPEALSRQLIDLSSAGPPLHSYNRQFVRIVIDAVGALAATLWLLRENELVLCEEIEQSPGAVKNIRVSAEEQQRALRTAFEQGRVVTLNDVAEGFDPLAPARSKQRVVVFLPVAGLRGNLGVVRLVFDAVARPLLSRLIQLAEILSGYYSLYTVQRILNVQQEERRSIDRLNKALLQLHHYSFSRQLPEVIVNSAMEVAPLDRVTLLRVNRAGDLSVSAVSSTSEAHKKGAWGRLVCEMGQALLKGGKPLHYFPGLSDPEQIEDMELRRQVNSYVLMTGAKSLLLFPLSSGGEKTGVLVMESFAEKRLSDFDRSLCTVYATHASSALVNCRLFERIPFSRFFGRKLDSETDEAQRRASKVGRGVKVALALLVAAVLVGLAGFYPVSEKISAPCFVVPRTTRLITAKMPLRIESADFQQGDYVQKSQLLIKLETDSIQLQLDKELENARNIEAQINKLLGEAEKGEDAAKPDSVLADIAALRHSLAAKRVEIELLRSRLEDCFLRAPIAGTVLEPEEPEKLVGVVVKEGEPLCRIGSIDEEVKIRIAVQADRIADVKEGMDVEIRLRPFVFERVIKGKIKSVAERSVTYKNSNVFMADVVVANTVLEDSEGGARQYLLKPGMTGKAKIIRPGKSTYLSIYGRALARKLKYWLF